MRLRRIALTVLLAAFSLANPAFAAVIQDYHVDLALHRDSILTVTETIAVDFRTELKHGIFRRIPVQYERSAGVGIVKVPTRYAIRLSLRGISDERGVAYPHKVWRDGRYLMIRIGNPDRYVSGLKVYRISYEVARAINYFDQWDELYWNVTGNEWEWPIQNVTCNVYLPPGTNARRVWQRTFTGFYGATTSRAVVQARDDTLAVAARSLSQGEGLTVVVGLPKGLLRPPDALQRFGWFMADNALLIVSLLIPFLAFGILLCLYLKNGRDPDTGQPVVVQYKPPANLTPAEVGTLVDERADIADIVSTILDLAVRGYVRIREIESPVFLFFQSKDYEFIKCKEFREDADLQRHERRFLEALFGVCDRVQLSELRNRFYTSLPAIRDAIYGQLVDKDLFPANPDSVRTTYKVRGIGAAVLSIALVLWLSGGTAISSFSVTSAQLLLLLSPALTGLVFFGFARAMPRKSRKGAAAAWQALGFKEFVQRVERDRIERLASEDPTVFERLLPFALVLGAADEWAQKFRGLALPPPTWYDSPNYSPSTFNATLFVHDLGHGMQSMASTFTS
ncbi:MAG: DUF2207 domain-containing protein, partial [Armatimonadetes bacterium]|nr:DUF2207 domain-containing protein [Armatimonadota bacterium]